MTVNEMYNLCKKLIDKGHGNKRIYQAYDCNYAFTGIGGKLKIKEDCIEFLESDYLDRSKDESNL